MRWRGVTVLTNTPPRSAQSAPGGCRGLSSWSRSSRKPRASSELTRWRFAASTARKARRRSDRRCRGKRQHATSAFLKEALDRGAEQFKWSERVARTPKRMGTKVRGVGVSLSCYVGGTIGFDGLLVIKPDGRITFQSGIGNLGTESVIDVHRAGAEVLGVPWEKCESCGATRPRTFLSPASPAAARRPTR
jgi:xanthine dehydrogenase molybdenum-binding subunit